MPRRFSAALQFCINSTHRPQVKIISTAGSIHMALKTSCSPLSRAWLRKGVSANLHGKSGIAPHQTQPQQKSPVTATLVQPRKLGNRKSHANHPNQLLLLKNHLKCFGLFSEFEGTALIYSTKGERSLSFLKKAEFSSEAGAPAELGRADARKSICSQAYSFCAKLQLQL